jgi:AbrB family looped-hinge helix DNA binding protein
MPAIATRLSPEGRVLIPAQLRNRLGLKTGDIVWVSEHDGEIRITTRKHAMRQAQALVRQHVPAETRLSDEFIAQRRAEAANE